MTTIAVSGAGGYVGGRLVQHLEGAGHAVRALVRRPVPWIEGSVEVDLATADPAHLAEGLVGVEAVVHLAGASEVQAARHPDGALASTTAAARRLAVAAAAAGVSRFVHLSTVHVYGAALDELDVVDEAVVPEPRHPYAIARLASEHLVAASGVESLIVLRLTNSVGAPLDPRVDRWTLVANELCAAAAAGRPLVLRSSGLQWRDFVDLGEACRVIGEAATGAVPAGTYNLGRGRSRTVRELAELVADEAATAGLRPEVVAPPHQGAVPRPTRIDIARLAAHVQAPVVPLGSSVRELLGLCRRSSPAGDGGVEG